MKKEVFINLFSECEARANNKSEPYKYFYEDFCFNSGMFVSEGRSIRKYVTE